MTPRWASGRKPARPGPTTRLHLPGSTVHRAAVAAAAALASLAAAVLAATASAAVRRVEIEGESMAPAFSPGDRLVVVRAPRWVRLRPGDVVAVPDPRAPERLLVKRVAPDVGAGAGAGDAVGAGTVVLLGDNAPHSTDSRDFGPVDRRSIWGIVRYRYAPAGRSGAVRRRERRSHRTVREP